MATLCSAYPSEAAARRAVDRLPAAGLPPQGAQLISGAALHDLRVEPVGEFAGRAAPDDPVRTFANTTVRRWRPGGSFAGDPDRQREGSFADVDGAVIVERDPGGHEHAHVGSLRELATRFADAGLAPEAVERALRDLRAGSSLVVAQVAEIGPEDARARLEAAAH